jgi:hypothetical protein
MDPLNVVSYIVAVYKNTFMMLNEKLQYLHETKAFVANEYTKIFSLYVIDLMMEHRRLSVMMIFKSSLTRMGPARIFVKFSILTSL